ncbi:MAG: NAD(P)H-quinone oxidoreductase [Mangrovicoccus sp.]|nr:NAD(P)H-quinone oxidoreductase [Mangrovicoccus sp.]
MQDMRVIHMQKPGTPDVLVQAQRPVPRLAAGEVLIRIIAAGVNGPDLVQRRGHYPPPKGASDLLGLEVSGEIVSLGEDVTGWDKGDLVCALTNGGGYGEYVAVRADHCLPIPEGVDPVDAAGLPETYFTVWSNVFHGHDVPEAANFLVHGGSGGIGTTAVQLGVALGLNVFTTVDSPEAMEYVTGLGAYRAIDFTTEDFVTICRGEGGMDIILDIIGGEYIARNIKTARHDARIIQLAFNLGSRVEIDLMPLMLKRLHLTGSTLRSRSDAFKAEVAADLRTKVWPLFAQGKLRPVTHKVLPLEEAVLAHKLMEAAQHRGKLLLKP